MKRRKLTTVLLILGMAISTLATGCDNNTTDSQENGVDMNRTDENADSEGDGLNNLANPIGDELDEIGEDLKEKVNAIVEKTEEMIEEKKEGN